MLLRSTLPIAIALSFASLPVHGGDVKKPAPPAAPREFAFVLSLGYGEGDHFSSDPKVFENLLINMRKSGFNTIHCVHRDWRVELCRKHNVKMMIDVLAWKEGGGTDIRKPEQRDAVKKICEKVRNDEAVWGYNLWNETLSFFGNPDGKNVDAYIAMLQEWDPTHPVWLGTRTVSYANALKQKPGVHGYYDYPWQRGFLHHFADLQWYYKYVPSQDGYIGRWEQGSNYNWNSYSLNTSIAFGTKVTIWFIGGPFDKEGNVDPKHRFHHLVKVGQETQKLYPELGKIGRPSAVFSTPTTKTHDNKPRDRSKDKDDVPWRLPAFPKDFWLRVEAGEVLAGFFQYVTGEDAIFVANHNAFAGQDVALSLADKATSKNTRLEMLDRETGKWKVLPIKEGRYAFALRPGGGELLRVLGRVKPLKIIPGKAIVPTDAMRRPWGELLTLDLKKRTGTFRNESNDEVMPFTVLPYAELLPHAAFGDLQDFRIGERAIFRLHQNDEGKWVWLTYIQGEMNFLNGHKEYYWVDRLDPARGEIEYTQANADKSFVRGKNLILETDQQTRYWKNGQPAKFADIQIGQKLRARSHGIGKGKHHRCWDLFLDDASLEKFQKEQQQVHSKRLAEEGWPGYIDETGPGTVRLTLFLEGRELAKELKTGRSVRVAAAGMDRKGGKTIEGIIKEHRPVGNLHQVTISLKAAPPEALVVTGVARLWLP